MYIACDMHSYTDQTPVIANDFIWPRGACYCLAVNVFLPVTRNRYNLNVNKEIPAGGKIGQKRLNWFPAQPDHTRSNVPKTSFRSGCLKGSIHTNSAVVIKCWTPIGSQRCIFSVHPSRDVSVVSINTQKVAKLIHSFPCFFIRL